MMFPQKTESEIRDVLSKNHEDIDLSIADLLDDDVQLIKGLDTTTEIGETVTTSESVQGDGIDDEKVPTKSVFELLSVKISNDTRKIKIDPEDLLSDALQVYKHPSFDPTHPFIVQYKQQPAVDTGGVLREFYSDVFKEFVNNPSVRIFEGPSDKLQFHYNHTALTCGMPKMLGTMIAHSLCQNGPGFPYLTPSQYYYVATGDINKAIAYASIHDIHDYEIKSYVEQIMMSKKSDLDIMNQSLEFQSLLANSGLQCQVTNENRLSVVQAIIAHCAVVKNVPMLEQFVSGLKTLGVIDVIRRYPDKFLQHFVHCAKTKTREYLKGLLKLKETGIEASGLAVFNMLQRFVEECSEEDIDKFIKFSTGCSYVLPPPTENIVVEVSPVGNIIKEKPACAGQFPERSQ
ncbi:G2/M phase-specific E3 ubiquitin-protein ligase-like [Dendronephthya gigantea]|uniref:G2/M phase-specific E3 ubiquitin-protein ligase-like n=1 Tax=Dendronephthya gigantea TaxID=151771 RepID=UPI00106BC7A4|nr:G2/M phase-specific E3 ubiquitin-protein ligase-like [Dendronephthya gigantea]